MDLTDGLLSIVVQSAERPHLTFQIDPTREMFLVSDSVVRYKSSSAGSQEARWIEVAKVEAMEVGKMAIRFHSTMTPVIAEQMLRRIAFQWSGTATDEEMTQAVVELSLQDRDGASGNSQNEQILIRLIDEESQ